MSLTVADVQAKCLNERVKALSDEQVDAVLHTAEAIILAQPLDTSVAGYTQKVDTAVLMLVDHILANPDQAAEVKQGDYSETFVRRQELPPLIQAVLRPLLKNSGFGELSRDGGL